MMTKDYVSKAWVFCSFAMLSALILMVSPYLSEGSVVEVDTVAKLYAEVNNPNNAGNTIKLLAAGSPYVLTQNAPNQGRLPLQTGMSLIGENVYFDHDGDGVPDPKGLDPEIFADTETVIDGSLLTGPRGIIELGRSNQSISKLTVRGNRTGVGDIDIRGALNSVSNVNISETILENGRRGIEVTNAQTNAEINLVAERNVIRHNIISPNPGFTCEDYPSAAPSGDVIGWGIRLTSTGGSGPRITADISHNRFYDNKINLFIPSLAVQNGVTTVVSKSNIYEEAVFTCAPGLPIVLSTGIFVFIRDNNNPLGVGSHGNRIHLISQDDAIWNNKGAAGVYADIHRDSNDVEIMDNEIEMEFHDTRFVKMNDDGTTFDGLQNRDVTTDAAQRRDITILGLHNSGINEPRPFPEIFTGPTSDNKIKVKVKKATTSLMQTDYDKKPQPFVVYDNAPDQVEVEFELEEINYIGSKNKK